MGTAKLRKPRNSSTIPTADLSSGREHLLHAQLSPVERDNMHALISDTMFYASQSNPFMRSRSSSNESLPISDSIIPVTFDLEEEEPSDDDEDDESDSEYALQAPSRIYSLGFGMKRRPDFFAISSPSPLGDITLDKTLPRPQSELDSRDSSADYDGGQIWEESSSDDGNEVEPFVKETSESPSVQGLIDAFSHVDLTASDSFPSGLSTEPRTLKKDETPTLVSKTLKSDVVSISRYPTTDSPSSYSSATRSFQKLKPDAIAAFVGPRRGHLASYGPVQNDSEDSERTITSLVPLQTFLRPRMSSHMLRSPPGSQYDTPTPRARRSVSESVLQISDSPHRPTSFDNRAPHRLPVARMLSSATSFAPYSSPFQSTAARERQPEFLPLGRVRRTSYAGT